MYLTDKLRRVSLEMGYLKRRVSVLTAPKIHGHVMGDSSLFSCMAQDLYLWARWCGGLSAFLPRETSLFSRGKNWEDLPDSGSPCSQDHEF